MPENPPQQFGPGYDLRVGKLLREVYCYLESLWMLQSTSGSGKVRCRERERSEQRTNRGRRDVSLESIGEKAYKKLKKLEKI
jgi:hypothetical protein